MVPQARTVFHLSQPHVDTPSQACTEFCFLVMLDPLNFMILTTTCYTFTPILWAFQLAMFKALIKRKLDPVMTSHPQGCPMLGEAQVLELLDFQPLNAVVCGSLMFCVPCCYMGTCLIALSCVLFPLPTHRLATDSWPDFIGSYQFCKTLEKSLYLHIFPNLGSNTSVYLPHILRWSWDISVWI